MDQRAREQASADDSAVSERVHREAIVIDATCPLLTGAYVDWWIEGGATAAAPSVGGSQSVGETLRSLGEWLHRIAGDPRLLLVRSAADIEGAKESSRFGIIFHFQGIEPIEDDLNLIDAYKALGVGMIQLSYNVRNRAGDGCEEPENRGLTLFGVELVRRLNGARVVVDCSHTAERTTLDAIALSEAPVVFSHAGVKALRPSGRNLSDEQIKAVAATGGLVGIVGFPAFVADNPRPSLDDYIDHIAYVADLTGIDHVGLGLDYFPGQAFVADDAQAERGYRANVAAGRWNPANYPPPPYYYPEGIETPRGFPRLTERLLERGFSEAETKQVLGGNWLRVFLAVWGN